MSLADQTFASDCNAALAISIHPLMSEVVSSIKRRDYLPDRHVVLLSGYSFNLYSHPVQGKFCVLFQLKQITWDSFLASIQITPNGLTPVCHEEPNRHEAIVIY